ncbi:MAG: CRISPR system precrRNA processing endoribonuclease RAMP protein Cas6 [Cyanobacteria bacterium J06621_11]
MPQSIILHLVTQSTVPPKHLQGYSLHQLFFNLVEVVDPKLGRALRRDKRNNFYSLSALQVKSSPYDHTSLNREQNISSLSSQHSSSQHSPSQHASSQHSRFINSQNRDSKNQSLKSKPLKTQSLKNRSPYSGTAHAADNASIFQHTHTLAIPQNTDCWWRISFLDDDLFDHLAAFWHQLKGEIFPIGTGSLSISHITTNTNIIEWANSCSYKDLYERASSYERDIQLQFVTPAALGQSNSHILLPTPEAVFQPLRICWNRHSGLAFTPSLISHITPTDFNIQTQSVQHIRRNSLQTFIGCIGTVSFHIGPQNDSLAVKRINAIADFAQYCSIGQGAQLGMGLVKRLKAAATLLEQPVP